MARKLIGLFDTKSQSSEEIFETVKERMEVIEKEKEKNKKNYKK